LPDDDPAESKQVTNVHNKMNDNTVTLVIYYEFVIYNAQQDANNKEVLFFLDTSSFQFKMCIVAHAEESALNSICFECNVMPCSP
jgi:hypothetical protein